MFRSAQVFLVLICAVFVLPAEAQDASDLANDKIDVNVSDWPWWRGPNRNGVAHSDQDPPVNWDTNTNVAWKADVPGYGHGSPIVVGDRVFLNSADEESKSQFVLCFDRNTGKQLWKTDVHVDGFPSKMNKKATHASSTPASDGKSIFVSFMSHGAVYATSLDLNGKQRWQERITDYVVHQGYGASPCLYQGLVIVGADNKKAGALAALDKDTGVIVWKRERPNKPNYPSPIVLNVSGKDQLLLTGCELVTSLSPLDGKELWEIEGSTTECVTSTVTDGNLIYTSGGYPDNHMSAVRADGSGKIVWQNRNRVYVPSLVAHDGYLYGVLDAGVAMCWECATGKEMWKQRVGGTFSSSPVIVNDRVYVSNEEGETFVFAATSEKYEQIAKNQLGQIVFATPAFCDDRIYTRVATLVAGIRQETLYCLAKE